MQTEAKSQHFLLSKQARALSVKRIVRLSDEEAFAEYVAVRFADNAGKPKCVRCGGEELYFISTRRKWKCADSKCQRQFSATTGTPFASRKLSYRDILISVALFAKAPKGLSAIRLSHELEVWYKTAFVLLHKIREAVGIHQHCRTLRGIVEVDGGYNGGYVRPRNKHIERIDRRRLRYSDRRQCVVIMRERWGHSRAFVCSEAEAARLVPQVVEPGSTIVADDSPVYNRLHGRYRVLRINHDKHFAEGEASTNWAESYFARLDRAEKGIHHRIAGDYLDHYANEMSWREDNRRRTDQEKFDSLAHLMTRGGVSRKWKGYWQRHQVAA
jgi:transposase-like protein